MIVDHGVLANLLVDLKAKVDVCAADVKAIVDVKADVDVLAGVSVDVVAQVYADILAVRTFPAKPVWRSCSHPFWQSVEAVLVSVRLIALLDVNVNAKLQLCVCVVPA